MRILLVERSPADGARVGEALRAMRGLRARIERPGEGSAADPGVPRVVMLQPAPGSRADDVVEAARGEPAILIVDDHDADVAALAVRTGAVDVLSTDELTPALLERSLRLALEHRRSASSEREASLHYRTLVESVGAIVWEGDPDTFEFTFVSPEAETLLGFPAERWVREPDFWLDHVHPDDREWAARFCKEATRRNEPHQFDYRMIAADGRVVWLRDVVRIRDEPGMPRRMVGVMIDITDQKRSDLARSTSEAQLARLFECAPEAIVRLDPDDRVVHVNREFTRTFDYTPEEAVGRPLSELIVPETHREEADDFTGRVSRGLTLNAEAVRRRRDGTLIEVSILGTPVHLGDEQIGVYGIYRDISERKRVEEALRTSEQSYRSLFESVSELVYVLDLEGRFIEVNPAVIRRYGYTRDELAGETPLFLADPEWEGVGEALELVGRAAGGEPQRFEWRSRTKAGEIFHKEISVTLGEYFGQSVLIAVGRDVTQRKRAEQELAKAEGHYRRLVMTSPEMIYALDVEGRMIELNPAGERVLGLSAEDAIGQHFLAVLPYGDIPTAYDAFRDIVAGRVEQVSFELSIVRPTGETRLLHVSAAAILEDDRIRGVHGIARDITEEREREERMRLLATALEQLDQGITVLDPRTLRVLFANAAHARMLGIPAGSAGQYSIESQLPDESAREQLREIQRVLEERGQWSGRIWRRRQDDGRVVPLDAVIGAVKLERTLLFTVLYDASEAIERERQLRRAERMASLGTMIGGVAHELNNPLSAIINFSSLLLDEPRPEQERDDLLTIQQEGERMARIVSDLRQFVNETRADGERRRVDLNEIVEGVLGMRRASLEDAGIRVRETLTRPLPAVLGDPRQLEQVVLNVVVNAEQAMAQQSGGELNLCTRVDAGHVVVEVADDGPGISGEKLERVFDPFWTTRSPGQGTGLGLALAHTIVQEHGGLIRVESDPGRRTAFRLSLPRVNEPASATVDAAVDRDAFRGRRVLVVDDEPAVLNSLVVHLRRYGCEVDGVASGDEAMRSLGAEPYEVVLSDQRMPGYSGIDLVREARAAGHAAGFVLLSGDVDDPELVAASREMRVPVLPKPAPVAEVVGMIERIVRGPEEIR